MAQFFVKILIPDDTNFYKDKQLRLDLEKILMRNHADYFDSYGGNPIYMVKQEVTASRIVHDINNLKSKIRARELGVEELSR